MNAHYNTYQTATEQLESQTSVIIEHKDISGCQYSTVCTVSLSLCILMYSLSVSFSCTKLLTCLCCIYAEVLHIIFTLSIKIKT